MKNPALCHKTQVQINKKHSNSCKFKHCDKVIKWLLKQSKDILLLFLHIIDTSIQVYTLNSKLFIHDPKNLSPTTHSNKMVGTIYRANRTVHPKTLCDHHRLSSMEKSSLLFVENDDRGLTLSNVLLCNLHSLLRCLSIETFLSACLES